MNILFQVITTTGGRFNNVGEEFIEGKGGKDCSEKAVVGVFKSTRYDYIWKGDIDKEDDYPEDACDPRYRKRTD